MKYQVNDLVILKGENRVVTISQIDINYLADGYVVEEYYMYELGDYIFFRDEITPFNKFFKRLYGVK